MCGEKSSRIILFDNTIRITPACAGKRAPLGNGAACHVGSPPRVRGKVLREAGRIRWFKDHPRVCGEKVQIWSAYKRHWGSPPRVRGKASSRW